ncbi:MAG TPA: hypothetical protein VGE66_17335, partial [Chitinophagaceae bacterium]
MRTYLPLGFTAFLLAACGKEPVKPPVAEQPVTKTVTFQVFAATDYSHPVYASTVVDVNLGISSVDLKTGKSTVVWDTTFLRRQLNLFPQHSDMYVVEKNIPVYESKEMLNAGHWVRYDTDGMVKQEGTGEGLIR